MASFQILHESKYSQLPFQQHFEKCLLQVCIQNKYVPSVTGTGSKRILPCGCWFLIGQKEESEVFRTVQFSSVTQSCPTLCDPMNPSTPGLPVHHQLPEFTQTHIHRVSDAIQPSHPLPSPSPALNPSQHRRFFQ